MYIPYLCVRPNPVNAYSPPLGRKRSISHALVVLERVFALSSLLESRRLSTQLSEALIEFVDFFIDRLASRSILGVLL